MIPKKQDLRNRNWRVDTFITQSGVVGVDGELLEDGTANSLNVYSGTTPIPGDNFYYRDPSSLYLYRAGNKDGIDLSDGASITHANASNTYVVTSTSKIGDDCVVTDSITDNNVTESKLSTDVQNRIFTTSGYRNNAELVISGDATPRVLDNMVYEDSIRDGAVSRVKENFVDGSVLGNLMPERWSWMHEAPYTVNTVSGTGGNWLNYTGSNSYFGRKSFAFSQPTTPATNGQTRIYFGTSPTDYNITLYPRSVFNATNFAYDETQYLNISANFKANASIFTNKPTFGIKFSDGTEATMANYAKSMTSTWTTIYDYVEVSGITSAVSGIFFLEQSTRQTVAKTFDLIDIQMFYSSKNPSTYFQDGANLYTPNLTKSITQDYIHPTFSLVPIGSILDYAGSTAPAHWLICSGQALAVASYSGLYNVLGYTYGGSAGTFYLPDLRGRVIAQASASHAFATISGAENLTPYTLSYTAGGSVQKLANADTGYETNIQPTYYLNKIIYTGQ